MLSKLSMLALAGLAAAELPPIHIKGQKFFYENGTQFFMKGIAYQQEAQQKGGGVGGNDYTDPISNEKICKRDVPLLKELGVNTIRTYAIDPKEDHDACMKLLDDAGIYVISDLSQPALSIKRDAPLWTTDHLQRYTDVVDELAKYPNVLGFFAGNEVSDAANNTEASAYVKAAVRDTKKHIKNNLDRELGVGYATNDHEKVRDALAEYFNCGSDDEAIDFWGYNIYSWCGESDMQKSGFSDWVDYYEDYSVPVFFAEYGCNAPGGAEGRKFKDTEALFSDEMTPVFSGGLVYMFHQEDNDYGVVEIKGDKAEKMKNFEALKKAHAKVDPEGVDEDDYNPDLKRETCPDVGEVWKSHSNLPPTPDAELCKCAVAASTCAVSEDVKAKDFGKMFGFVCENDKEACSAINGNATTGVYGAYSMCDDRSKLTILLGMYAENAEGDDACDFDGKAETKSANAQGSCDDKLAKASDHNKEAATATVALENAEATGSGSGSDDEEDFGVMSAPIARLFSVGDMAVGLYMVVAMGVGATMVVL